MLIKQNHLLKLLLKLLLTANMVIEGDGFDIVTLILLNDYFSFWTGSIRFSYFGGFYMYFGKGLIKP